MVSKRIAIIVMLCLIACCAAGLAAAREGDAGGASTGPMAMPPRPGAAAPDQKPQPADRLDMIIIDSRRLDLLRLMALEQSPRWQRLVKWCLDPARQDANPADGPNLALAALILAPADQAISHRLGQLAGRCALNGARMGRAEQVSGNAVIDGGLPWTPQELAADGYDLLAFGGQAPAMVVKNYVQARMVLEARPAELRKAATENPEYFLLLSDPSRAAKVVQDVALTLSWSRDSLGEPQQRQLGRWLAAQAKVMEGQGLGCFDARSAAALKVMALAGRAAGRLDPAALQLLARARRERFETLWRPALENMGEGGGWFGGSHAGAVAGLDLLMFAAALPTQQRAGVLALPWFRDRQAMLVNSLLPQADQGPDGPYRGVCPSGDADPPAARAADLIRLQMLLAHHLQPQADQADLAQAMLLATDVPSVTDIRLLGLEFLLLDEEDPGLAPAVAPLDYAAPAVGRAFSRSGWGAWDTLVAFDCGPHFAASQHLAAGSIQIFLKGPLLPRSGAYDGPETPHAQNYAARSVAHNTLLIRDPAEYSWFDMRSGARPRGTYANDGGQRSWSLFDQSGAAQTNAPWTASGWESGPAPWTVLEPIYRVAGLAAQDHGPRFAYFAGDASAAYQGSTGKARRVARHLFHLRPGGPDDATAAEAVVVIDDVLLARPELSPTFVLHLARQPVIEGQMQPVGPGRLQGQTRLLRAQTDGAELWVASLHEQPAQVELFGPPAIDWVDGRGYPPAAPAVEDAPWRVELTPLAQEGLQRVLIHALLPAVKGAPGPPALTRLASPDPLLAGLVIHDRFWPRVVAVRLGPDGPDRPLVYGFPAGRSRHLVAGLRPEAEYAVTATAGQVTISPGKGLKASQGGVLAFKLAPAQDGRAPATVTPEQP